MNIQIIDISASGEGIGKIDGKVYFVPNALPGESVEIEIIEDKGKFAKGRIIGSEPTCGGCPLLRYPYEKQLAWKEKRVRDCLERIAKIDNPPIMPIVGMENPYSYRNKCEFKVGVSLPYCNVNCTSCPIQDEQTRDIVSAFRDHPIKNAEEFIVRTTKTGEHMAFTVQQSGYILLYSGDRIIHDYIDTDMGRLTVEVDPFSFYQINSVQTSKLYSIAQKYAAPGYGDTILDLYCGCGSIGLSMAKYAARVIGVESVKSAVLLANRNAVLNQIVNATFICGKAETVVDEKLQGINADIVILDPPRAGCKESLLKTVAEIAPERIVYISCNPATLARDLARFASITSSHSLPKYELKELTPVDMFPHTAHCETVVLLRRENPDTYIDIDVDIEELYSVAGGTASYLEIQGYIKDKYGLNVSSLNIAQVKDKYNLKERKNYNLGEPGHRVPNCPKEKEDAIVDALKHFELLLK